MIDFYFPHLYIHFQFHFFYLYIYFKYSYFHILFNDFSMCYLNFCFKIENYYLIFIIQIIYIFFWFILYYNFVEIFISKCLQSLINYFWIISVTYIYLRMLFPNESCLFRSFLSSFMHLFYSQYYHSLWQRMKFFSFNLYSYLIITIYFS
jgi:hypothetical protein